MTVDPAEPDSFRDRFADPLDDEAPEADAAEQLTDVQPQEDDPLTGGDREDAPEADAAEQARVVPLDEEDYR
ncbi:MULTISPECIES: hypothetical protein [Streptomyces]|uniref:Uncharacterized protein n=1 Tax=Streptomyces katrae TaxID=68223 RepID=A0A0F4ISE4_9ACTN|nr:hypothetical protein [Streptomyces katrae]KJY24413.1 hypothetical protein VR44_35425 [Streptomyces katrae]MCF3180285.1 hypothetical protein [Streptomyces polychromogenes]